MKLPEHQKLPVARTTPDEPIECPLCGLDPVSAMSAGVSPAILTHPGWIQCDCRGDRPYNVAEALLQREERSEESELKREIRQCWWEDVNRNHEPGSSSSGSSDRDKRGPGREIRPEQEWHGFSQADLVETERLEHLEVPIKGKLPKFLKDRWRQQTTTTESRLLRWLIAKHLDFVKEVPTVPRGVLKVPFKFLLTPEHAALWNSKKKELGCSSPQLLAAILLKEWE